METEDAGSLKTMRLRFAGSCSGCGVELPTGTTAEYDRVAKIVTCIDCVRGRSVELQIAPDTDNADIAIELTTIVDIGVPGASARREEARRHDKRETRIREALPKLGGLYLALTDDPQSTKAWAVGARGEERLGLRLNELASEGVLLLHDRRIPPKQSNIDHIVVCPSGVFAVDAKRYRNQRPSLGVEGGLFRPRVEKLLIDGRNRTPLVDGVLRQVEKIRDVLTAAGFDHVPVHGMLCFVEGNFPILGGDFSVNGVQVLWPSKVASFVRKPGALSAAEADAVHHALATAFPVA